MYRGVKTMRSLPCRVLRGAKGDVVLGLGSMEIVSGRRVSVFCIGLFEILEEKDGAKCC